MTNFYYGQDSIGKYWINLDHVSFAKLEKDNLILKMQNSVSILIDGDDASALSQILWNKTLNWEEEFIENHKRHNQEDIPPPSDFPKKPTSQYCSNEEYGWILINWDVVEYLLDNYRSDWEGSSPNGVDLDSFYQNLKEAYDSYLRIFFPDFAESRVQSEF